MRRDCSARPLLRRIADQEEATKVVNVVSNMRQVQGRVRRARIGHLHISMCRRAEEICCSAVLGA